MRLRLFLDVLFSVSLWPIAIVAGVSFTGCAAPYLHQVRLGDLHSRAAKVCKTDHLTCAALQPCSIAVRTALADWQAVSVASSKGDDVGEAAALIVAASSEVAAFAVCKGVR